MKLKLKLILDAAMLVLLIILFNYEGTGGFVHELLGIIILAGFLTHVILNRKYYGAMRRALKKRRGQIKNRIAFVVNVTLLAAACVMLVSSMAISHDLVPFISSFMGLYNFWVIVHVFCAVLLLVSVFTHIILHAKMFTGLIRKAAKSPSVVKAWRAGSRITAVILALLVIKISIDNVAGVTEQVAASERYAAMLEAKVKSEEAAATAETTTAAETTTTEETTTAAETTKAIEQEISRITFETEESSQALEEKIDEIYDEIVAEDNYNEEDYEEEYYEEEYYEEDDEWVEEEEPEYEPEPEPEEEVISLEDYLGSMFCSGCGRHCSLLSPRCGKGENRASEATAEYYAIYQA